MSIRKGTYCQSRIHLRSRVNEILSYLCRSKKKKKKAQEKIEKLEKFIVKPGEESTYHPVEEKEDYRTEAEKRFDEHLSQRVSFHC